MQEPENQCDVSRRSQRHTIGRPDRLRGASPRHGGPLSVDAVERACGEPVEDRRSRAKRDTVEPRQVGATRHPACANAWRGAGAAWKARERRGFCMSRAELVRQGSCGGRRGRRQGTVKRARRIAAFRTGAWRGTWLRRFREQAGVWRKRGSTVGITDHGCAGEDEGLA